jgi:hypothetical protein
MKSTFWEININNRMFIENLWRRRQWRQYDITEIHIKIYPVLVLFEQSNFIDWIIFFYVVTDQNIAFLVTDSCWATERNGNSISTDVTDDFYTSRQCTNTVYLSGKVKRSKIPAKLSENSWNKRRSNSIQRRHLWRQYLYCYRFFLLLNRNQVPTSPSQILNKHSIVDVYFSKCTFHPISPPMLCLKCDIALRIYLKINDSKDWGVQSIEIL